MNFVNKSPNENPSYGTVESSGADLRAWITKDNTLTAIVNEDGKIGVSLNPLERVMIHTGIYIDLPEDKEAQIRPRSGLAAKRGLTVLNSPGTIDTDYVGEICVIIVNLSNEIQFIENGERIAQCVIMPRYIVDWVLVDEIVKNTSRGGNGFGHTGKF